MVELVWFSSAPRIQSGGTQASIGCNSKSSPVSHALVCT